MKIDGESLFYLPYTIHKFHSHVIGLYNPLGRADPVYLVWRSSVMSRFLWFNLAFGELNLYELLTSRNVALVTGYQ